MPFTKHAEELSRAISEINLNTVRDLGTGPDVHDTEVRDVQDIKYENSENFHPGISTPDVPGAPPPTPATPGHNIRAKEDSTSISPLKELEESSILHTIDHNSSNDPETATSSVPPAVPDKEEVDSAETSEPDEATMIRRQVEYYFSDHNLLSDIFLQKKTEGKNKPVKLEIIAGFGRMRKFRPYSSIVSALKDSVSLEISGSNGEETVKRKKPYDAENLLRREETYTDIGRFPKVFDGENFVPNPTAQAGEKKKKKSSGGSKKAKRPPPTGFEEFYADPPMTPDEAIDEIHDTYNPARPFHERMESCIQNYRARRKLDELKAKIFTKYLIIGGIEASSNKQFTGLDKAGLEESTAKEIKAFQATDFIRGGISSKYYDPKDDEHWVVDFSGVVSGFLSHTFPHHIGFTSLDEVQIACGVIKNFLNYVLHHSVCPEYTEDIMNARRICDKAEEELWALPKLGDMLPGDYNMASSTLWGGQYRDEYVEPSLNDSGGYLIGSYGMHPKDAERYFNVCIALTGTEEQYLAFMRGQAKVLKCEQRNFEVVEIERATVQTIEHYAGIKDRHGKAGTAKPLGLLKVKAWEGPQFIPEDSSDDGVASPISTDIETFWIDDSILQHCFIGLKLVCKVHEMEFGIKYFDSISGIYCSFFTYLENEKMRSWKAPISNDRPAPTEDDTKAEEVQAAQEARLDDADEL